MSKRRKDTSARGGVEERYEEVRALLALGRDRGYLAYPSQVPLALELGVGGNREGWMTLDEFLTEAQTWHLYHRPHRRIQG